MLRTAIALCLTGSAVIGFSGPSMAQIDVCNDDTVSTTDAGRKVTYVDALPEGLSVGDMRVGQKDMLDSDGNKVGVFRWSATVMETDNGAGKPIYSVRKFYEFEDGVLFGSSLDNTSSPVGDTSIPSIVSGRTSIVGGLGRYVGATGLKRHERHPDSGDFTYYFEIDCH